jgi:PhoH-like ATPase
MAKKVFVDTNILLNPSFDFSDYDKVIMSITTTEELDGLKKSEEIGHLARMAIKNIINAVNKEVKLFYSNNSELKFLEHKNDNTILKMAKESYDIDNEILFLTDDYNLKIKADAINLPCEMFEFKVCKDDIYTGIRETSITEQKYVDLLEGLDKNPYNLYLNEYLIVNNTTTKDQYLLMWNGKFFEEAKAKPISNKYINKINPLDIYQRAFIHMLQNDNIKVKITDSNFGCGKSFLMIHWALQMIDKGKYSKMIFIKSDSPPKGRKEFPAIPGDVNEKCNPLMGVLCDSTGENNFTDILLRNHSLEVLPIQFARGRSLKDSIVIINEAQNFTPSEMEILLSRLDENSVALIDGSNKQTDNKYCIRRSGLTAVSENFKDKEIAAQVNMITDFRSDISKLVGEMNWNDK